MLATGGSAAKAIEVLKESNVPEERIMFLNLISAPPGINMLREKFPQVKLVTTAIDEVCQRIFFWWLNVRASMTKSILFLELETLVIAILEPPYISLVKKLVFQFILYQATAASSVRRRELRDRISGNTREIELSTTKSHPSRRCWRTTYQMNGTGRPKCNDTRKHSSG